MLNGRDVTQEDRDRLEGWANRDLMKFNNDKHDVLSLGTEHPQHQYKRQLSD